MSSQRPLSIRLSPGLMRAALVGVAALAATGAAAQGRGTRDYGPMVIGDWLFTPTLMMGGIYNDNVFASSTNKVGRLGTSFSLSGYASRIDGVSQTQVYGIARGDIYPSESEANAFTGAVGATHSREFGRDLLFDAGVEIARIQNSLQAQVLSPTNSLDLSSTNYTQFQARTSLRKTFNRVFVEGRASFVTQVYDDSTLQTGDRNGYSARFGTRLGYEVSRRCRCSSSLRSICSATTTASMTPTATASWAACRFRV